MLWFFGFGVVLVAAVDQRQLPNTGFSCDGRTTGYYADVRSGCQVYHMCDGLGRQFSYTCPNATLFQQRMLICDHWYMVNCSKSEEDYTANLRIGRKMPFVDDSETSRTPRPDLLAHHSQSEYDIIYRTGKAQFGTNLNLVGIDTDKTDSTTDKTSYSLPSHWSTEYNSATQKPKSNKKTLDGTIKGKPINPVTEVPINYKSSFKATTPVFPKTVDISTEAPDDLGLVPPLPYQIAAQQNEIPVNFQSNFKATTPVYPLTVDITSEEPSEIGIVPPEATAQVPSLNLNFEAPAFDPNFVAENRTQEVPSLTKFYQPPKFEPDFTENQANRKMSENELVDLRKKFFVPDYVFPLESVSRPSYDTVYSSFEASGKPGQKK